MWIRPEASAPNIRTDLVLNLTLTVSPPPTGLHPYPALAPSWTAASSPASTAYPREITPRIVLFVFSLNRSCSSAVADLRGAGLGFVYENLIRCSARCSVRTQPNAQILLLIASRTMPKLHDTDTNPNSDGSSYSQFLIIPTACSSSILFLPVDFLSNRPSSPFCNSRTSHPRTVEYGPHHGTGYGAQAHSVFSLAASDQRLDP